MKAALILLAALCAGCSEPRTGGNENEAFSPIIYRDKMTGCEYLTTDRFEGITPRIASDGVSHQGCRAGGGK